MDGQGGRKRPGRSVEPESFDFAADSPEADLCRAQACAREDTLLQGEASVPFFTAAASRSSPQGRECSTRRVLVVERQAKKAVEGIWLDRRWRLSELVGP